MDYDISMKPEKGNVYAISRLSPEELELYQAAYRRKYIERNYRFDRTRDRTCFQSWLYARSPSNIIRYALPKNGCDDVEIWMEWKIDDRRFCIVESVSCLQYAEWRRYVAFVIRTMRHQKRASFSK